MGGWPYIICNRCPLWLSGIIHSFTSAGCSKNVSCLGYVNLPVVVESWLLLAHLCVRLIFRFVHCEDWPHLHCMEMSRGGLTWKQNLPQMVLVSAETCLWVCHLCSLSGHFLMWFETSYQWVYCKYSHLVYDQSLLRDETRF